MIDMESVHNDEWFGVVRWNDEDIVDTLSRTGYIWNDDQIGVIRSMCEHHNFTDMMIQPWVGLYLQVHFREKRRMICSGRC